MLVQCRARRRTPSPAPATLEMEARSLSEPSLTAEVGWGWGPTGQVMAPGTSAQAPGCHWARSSERHKALQLRGRRGRRRHAEGSAAPHQHCSLRAFLTALGTSASAHGAGLSRQRGRLPGAPRPPGLFHEAPAGARGRFPLPARASPPPLHTAAPSSGGCSGPPGPPRPRSQARARRGGAARRRGEGGGRHPPKAAPCAAAPGPRLRRCPPPRSCRPLRCLTPS